MKARQADSHGEDGSAWVARRGGKAYRQGQGTRRMIVRRQAEGSTIVAYPVRAADWDVGIGSWPACHSRWKPTSPGSRRVRAG